MHRPITGKIVTQSTQGETVQAFVPDPLPPVPPIAWTNPLIMAQQRAATALGRLDGIT
jgi:hypothetical protein